MNTLRFGPLSLRYHRRSLWVGVGLVSLLLVLSALILCSGTIRLSFAEIWQAIWKSGEDARTQMVVHRIRLPRLLTALGAGAALGASGAVFQSISRNPLGSPDIMGLTAGAASGALLQIILFNAGPLQTAFAALVAGIGTAGLVLAMAQPKSNGANQRMILIGIGLGALLSGLNTLLIAMSSLDSAMAGQVWLAGSLAARSWSDVALVGGGLCLFLPPLLLLSRRLELSEMGEDMARALGISVAPLRIAAVLSGVGLAATATAATGPIAFIALTGPHLARRLTKRTLSPVLSGLCGATFLLCADYASQNAPMGLFMPIGLTTALFGGIWMLALVLRRPMS